MAIDSQATFPAQSGKWTDDKYKAQLQWLATQWNRPYFAVASANYQNKNPQTAGIINEDSRWVYNYIENAQYYFGSQTVSDYGFFKTDARGYDTKIPMYRGMDVRKICDYLKGSMIEGIEHLPETTHAYAYSPLAISKKKIHLDLVRLKFNSKGFFAAMKEIAGIDFMVKDIEDEASMAMEEETFQDAWEKAYESIARDVIIRNNYLNKLAKVIDYILIGGIGCLKVYAHKGKIKWKVLKPVNAIYDMSKDDDQHDDDDYAGEVYAMTVSDLVDRFEWTDAEIEDLNKLAKSGVDYSAYNTYTGINGLLWWNIDNGIPKITVVEGQWRSIDDKDGIKYEVLREGCLIGNKYLKECMVSDNQVYSKTEKSKKLLKYRIVTPNTIMGTNIGIVGMVKRIQNLKDGIATAMVDLVSKAIGKSYVVYADRLPEGLQAQDFISQLKQANIVVVEGVDIDQNGDTNGKQLPIQAIDLTLDPNVQYLLSLIQYYDNVIADTLNVPLNVRGQLKGYQPTDALGMSMQQSATGLKWLYTNFALFVDSLINYSADLGKNTLPETNSEQFSLLVGDGMVELFQSKEIKEMSGEDFFIRLKGNDVLSEKDKGEYTMIAQQLAAAGKLKMSDYFRIKTMMSKTQIANYLDMRERQMEKKAQEEQMMAMEQAQQQQQMNADAMKYQADSAAESKMQSTAMNNDAKMEMAVAQEQQQLPPA